MDSHRALQRFESCAKDNCLADEPLTHLPRSVRGDKRRFRQAVHKGGKSAVVDKECFLHFRRRLFDDDDQQLLDLVVQNVVERMVGEQVENVVAEVCFEERFGDELLVAVVEAETDVDGLKDLVDLGVQTAHFRRETVSPFSVDRCHRGSFQRLDRCVSDRLHVHREIGNAIAVG